MGKHNSSEIKKMEVDYYMKYPYKTKNIRKVQNKPSTRNSPLKTYKK